MEVASGSCAEYGGDIAGEGPIGVKVFTIVYTHGFQLQQVVVGSMAETSKVWRLS